MTKNIKKKEMIPLFEKFIQESKNGSRIQKNGKRISLSSITSYKNTLNYIIKINNKSQSPIAISCNFKKNRQEIIAESKYWASFFVQFKKEMYLNGCSDNYVGLNIKNLKTFFKYLESEKFFPASDFYKKFYPPHFETQIFVLEQDKLRFLISNLDFENTLSDDLKTIKDIFVVGCTISLRYSDLISLKKTNLHYANNNQYIVTTSKKTNTQTRIKIPNHIKEIIDKYKKRKNTKLFPEISLWNFNRYIKILGELAGWTYTVEKQRVFNGQKKEVKKNGLSFRYCDRLSSHTMRKTAITTLLTLGMPEQIVRKISGHSVNSKEFYKYVKYSDSFQDDETDKAFSKLIQTLL
jgi:integrase